MNRPIDIIVDRIREGAVPSDERTALYARKLEFRSGPQNHTFYACERHRAKLETGDVDCFFAVDRQPIRALDPEDEIECDFCREP